MKGYSLVSRFLDDQSCDELISNYNNSDLYRKTITMERHRFGLGEYKYLSYLYFMLSILFSFRFYSCSNTNHTSTSYYST
jgi:hypothetical protein